MAFAYTWEAFIRNHGDVGARDMFEKLMDELLRAENPEKEVHKIKASQGDGGIDLYVYQERGIDVYQCKFFMGSMNSSRWAKVRDSFNRAVSFMQSEKARGVEMLRWFLCMPREMQKEDIAAWQKFCKGKESLNIDIKYIDGNEIISRLHKVNRELISKYFVEPQEKRFTNKALVIPFTKEETNGAQGGTYVPRDDLLKKIEDHYKSCRGKKMVFLTGMGGCGKSELARAFADKHIDDYDDIFWITCTNEEEPTVEKLIAGSNTLCEITKRDIIEFSNRVLIIVDNCNMYNEQFIHELNRGTGNACILVTTRLNNIGNYTNTIQVISDVPDVFSYLVFEKNYCKRDVFGDARNIRENEVPFIQDICREVQYNTMIVSLLGIRLRQYNDLSIYECAEKIRSGITSIKGKVNYSKDQVFHSEELKEIMNFLFSDILNYKISDAQSEVLTILSMRPSSWYAIEYICKLLGGIKDNTMHHYAITSLLDLGWLQQSGSSITVHPLIAEVMTINGHIISDSLFFETTIENYLGLPNKFLNISHTLINKILHLAIHVLPEAKIATMLLINHGQYKTFFAHRHPEIKVACFTYVNISNKRLFFCCDLNNKSTNLLYKVKCFEGEEDSAKILKIFNTGVYYTLDLNVRFFGKPIYEIPDGLCWNDKFLSSLCLPNEIIKIGKSAFEGCGQLRGQLHLPSMVTSIGDSAFKDCVLLGGELDLPNSLVYLGESAFSGLKRIHGKIHLSDNITIINEKTFENCHGIEGDLQLPKRLKIINRSAFYGCSGLSGILHLPDSLTSIGESAFHGCHGLSGNLYFQEGLISIGDFAFSECSGFNGELHFPSTITYIGDFAFSECSGFKGELHFPSNITYIGEYAFSNCKNFIGSLHLPDNITRINNATFQGCEKLDGNLHLPNKLKEIGNSAFSGCENLTGMLLFPENLIRIGESAFFSCCNFTGWLKLPKSLNYIGSDAFAFCYGLSGELRLPKHLKEQNIGDNAFNYCVKLNVKNERLKQLNIRKKIYDTHNKKDVQECASLNDIQVSSGELQLPKGLTIINEKAFYKQNNIGGELRLSKGVISIEDYAFYKCTWLRGNLYLPEGLTRIGDYAFDGCTGLSGELYLPKSLISIGHHAFKGCTGLKGKLHFPEGLTRIGEHAFDGCTGLNGELYLPNSVTRIGHHAFNGCTGFSEELHLPEGLRCIDEGVFCRCSGLVGNLQLPGGLKKIDDYAFDGCVGLSGELYIPDNITYIGFCSFNNCSGFNGELHLPKRLTKICYGAFCNCNGLSGELSFPKGLKEIGGRAFSHCDKITKLNFSEGLEYIYREAFFKCEQLSGELTLPESLKFLGIEAFLGCPKLKGEIHFSKNLDEIEKGVFSDSQLLTKCVFYNSHTKIGDFLCEFSSIVISGYRNSTAENYAHSKNLLFEDVK